MLTHFDKKSFSQRLNLVLDRHNYPPKNSGRMSLLAEKFGITHKAAANWINGVSLPSRKKVKRLSELFDVTEDWLLFGEKYTSNSGLIKIPVLSRENVKPFLDGKMAETDIENWTEVQDSNSFHSFAIEVSNEEIEFNFLLSKDTKLVFDPNKKPRDKLFALILHQSRLLLTRLIEFEKGQFAVKFDDQHNTTSDLVSIDAENTVVAVLSEIKF